MVARGQFDVFISYSHDDREVVDRILDQLQKIFPTLRFWIDRENLIPGSDWADEILKAATETNLFLIYGSRSAFKSNWVQREIGIALQRKLLDRIPVVLLAADKKVIPNDLIRYQYIDFEDESIGLGLLEEFLRQQFISVRRHRTHDHALDENAQGMTLIIEPPCEVKLKQLPDCDLRYKIEKGLSRAELAVVWFDVFGEAMEDIIPGQGLANCTMELLIRARRRSHLDDLFKIICRMHKRVADIVIE